MLHQRENNRICLSIPPDRWRGMDFVEVDFSVDESSDAQSIVIDMFLYVAPGVTIETVDGPVELGFIEMTIPEAKLFQSLLANAIYKAEREAL